MKTLCLDLASVVGFAVGDAASVQAHGSFALPKTGNDIGAFLHSYRAWLSAGISRWTPQEIVFESPILPDTTSIHTLRKLYGLCGITELLAQDSHIICREANLLDIRGHFIGARRTPKEINCEPGCTTRGCGHCRNARRRWTKDATISMCRKRGFRPSDDNDADALALFSFVQSTKNPKFELLGTEIARAA